MHHCHSHKSIPCSLNFFPKLDLFSLFFIVDSLMAFAALASLAHTIDLILNYHQTSISPQLKHQIISIDEYIIFFQSFLEDLPGEGSSLEGRIRELTQVAEDVIEFLLSEQVRDSSLQSTTVGPLNPMLNRQLHGRWKRIQSRIALLKKSSKSKLKHQPRVKMYEQLKIVADEIESIAEEVMEIKSSVTVKDMQLGDSTAASSLSRVASVHRDAMVGFDDDVMLIKSRLCGESSRLEFVPIVGMGGIGKTTLARNAYDDQLISEHFQIRVWVTVAQDYNVDDIASALVVSMKVPVVKQRKESNEERVYKYLKGRRYLIVLDDIWSTKVWDDLKKMFPDDINGSRIMLTTRLPDVASYAYSSSPLHEMRLMNDAQSWNLLQQRVFKQDSCPAELKHVGKRIAKRCKGLPLAIVAISGILSTVDQTVAAWESVARNVKSAISANDEQIDKILSLSYTHLPHHLRPLFLYMGGFPEDHQMRASIIIKQWVAEGFLRRTGCKYNQSFEETADEYLEDLVKRSLVMVSKRKSNGRIKSFTIHDLMREMCIRKAQEEKFFSHVRMNIPRHVFFDSELYRFDGCSTIRTMVGVTYLRLSLVHFRLLRVLDLISAHEFLYKNDNPSQIFELFHLRYLAFDFPFKIPPAISNLENLQTLIVGPRSNRHGCFDTLPQEIWRLPQLRHLVSYFCLLPPCEGVSTFPLENLQTLSVAIDFICSEKILEMIPNLRKLEISYSMSADDEGICDGNYQLQNLVCLQHLENLTLVRKYKYFPYTMKVKPVFPTSLKKLTLSGWGLSWEDMKIVGSLPNLEVLKLRDHAFIGDTWETTEGYFSELKLLLIDTSDLECWITENSHFPKLRCLVLHRCLHLKEIPDDIGEISTLELIEVDYWNTLLVDSAKRVLNDQRSYGNDDLQVRWLKELNDKSTSQMEEEEEE